MRFSITQSVDTSTKQSRILKEYICIETVTVTTFNFKRFSHCFFFAMSTSTEFNYLP